MGRTNTSQRGSLPAPRVSANDGNLTQFSGLVPLIRYMTENLGLVSRLRSVAGSDGVRRIYARHLVMFAFLVGALGGVERLAHLEWLRGDAVMLKFLRLPKWPVRKVFAQALASLTDAGVQRLLALIAEVGLAPVRGHKHAVLDMDSSAIVTFGTQEGAKFGYSGKGRNRRRHHPLVASVAGARAVVHADYRDGSGINAKEIIRFSERALAVLRGVLADGAQVILRADSGFWSNDLAQWLLDQAQLFILVLPLRPGIKLFLRNTSWRGLDGDPDIQSTVIPGVRLGLDSRLRIVGIRRRILDPKAPPQGKAIEGCTHWRYQALVSNMEGGPVDLWRFYNDRADCERVFKEARGALGMGWLIGHELRANETAFLLRLLAFNADQRFQRHATEVAKKAERPIVRLGLLARQHRFYLGAGRLLKSQGQWLLRVRDNLSTSQLWAFYAPELVASG